MTLKRLFCLIFIVVFSTATVAEAARPQRSNPRFAAMTIDARTGAVLYAENADASRYPASLTKVMTLYIVFQELKAGRIKLSSTLNVSARASRMAPSKMGLKPGTSITVEQAIKSLIVKSANDVAAVVGENLGGTESAFAVRMTRTARNIGMNRTTYRNASGLPIAGQITTARDQATLALRIMRDFPQYYPYFRLQGFTFRGRTIRSHNRLVGRFPGTDGLKTGYIAASGYNLVTSTKRGDKRLVGVVLGGTSASRRNSYMMQMLSSQFSKAKNGRTIAALAGSSVGAIDPIALASASAIASEPESPPAASAEAVANLAEAAAGEPVAAEVGMDEEESAEMDANELAALSKASDGRPQVMEAKLDEETPDKLPFAIKDPAAKQGGVPLTEDIGSSSDDGDWDIQVGVFKSKKAAEAKLSMLRGSIKILNGRSMSTVAMKNRLFKAKFSGFDKKEALSACQRIEEVGGACLPLAPKG